MKLIFMILVLMMMSIPNMTNADENKNLREITSVTVKNELVMAQEKHKKELQDKIDKIILSEVNFKN